MITMNELQGERDREMDTLEFISSFYGILRVLSLLVHIGRHPAMD